MKIIGVDLNKCIRCEECIKECPSKLYRKEETNDQEGPKIVFDDEFNACILCGHCIAICPRNAIMWDKEIDDNLWEFEEIKDPSKIIDINNLMKFIRSRRSIRRFQNKKVPKEKIELILEAMRYAPSASNLQDWNYTVITDPDKIKYFQKQIMKSFYFFRSILKFKNIFRFFVFGYKKKFLTDPKTKKFVDDLIRSYEMGIDRIFYNAPCIIVLDLPKYDGMEGNNAGIAITHGMLAAQSLGLGTCWIGFAQEAIKRDAKLRQWIGIKNNRVCQGVLIIGYPAIRFLRAPPREKLKIKWL